MTHPNPISGVAPEAEHRTAQLLVVVSDTDRERIEALNASLAETLDAGSYIIATQEEHELAANPEVRIIALPPKGTSWLLKAPDYINAYEIADKYDVRAILMLGPDANSLSPPAIRTLADAVLNTTIDLAMPHYALPPNIGLVNSAILYPVTRSLFAVRARFPLAIDMVFSMRMAQRLAIVAQRIGGSDEAILWPVSEAVAAGFAVNEYDVGPRAIPQPSESDVNAMLTLIIGSLFADIEAKAAIWQRPRRPPAMHADDSPPSAPVSSSDVAKMVEAFRLGNANLQEIWTQVLPPHSLVMLKRFSAVEPSSFRMPENLWARIVFDFLIAYRLRHVNRGHLLGALIPLYLGWVASHINLTASGVASERHIEAVASAFEADKPYLVARWRWPDRFNS